MTLVHSSACPDANLDTSDMEKFLLSEMISRSDVVIAPCCASTLSEPWTNLLDVRHNVVGEVNVAVDTVTCAFDAMCFPCELVPKVEAGRVDALFDTGISYVRPLANPATEPLERPVAPSQPPLPSEQLVNAFSSVWR